MLRLSNPVQNYLSMIIIISSHFYDDSPSMTDNLMVFKSSTDIHATTYMNLLMRLCMKQQGFVATAYQLQQKHQNIL